MRRSQRRSLIVLVCLGSMLMAALALARPGGGHTYGGDGSSSGPSSGSGDYGGGSDGGGGAEGAIIELLLWLLIEHPAIGIPACLGALLFYVYVHKDKLGGAGWTTPQGGLTTSGGAELRQRMERAGAELDQARLRSQHQSRVRGALERLRQHDPMFSLIVFEDFVHALFVDAHVARGAGKLAQLAPWLSQPVRATLAGWTDRSVEAVVIGVLRYVDVRGIEGDSPRVGVTLEIEANYSESETYWVVERWSLSRNKSARSRPPKRARVFACPNCGAPLDRIVGSECQYCRTVVDTGDFDWVVESVERVRREARSPALTGTTPERGTDRPTLVDADAERRYARLTDKDPAVGWSALEARVRLVFAELGRAWNAGDLRIARAYLTDRLFETLGYWIDAQQRAGLRNVNENARIVRVVIARVTEDAHFDAITVRIFATGLDYTLNAAGEVAFGSKSEERAYSEYWTLIRGVTVRGAPRTEPVCPSCGAPAQVNQAGVCGHCGVEVTAGDFDWVLSRIEQDDAY